MGPTRAATPAGKGTARGAIPAARGRGHAPSLAQSPLLGQATPGKHAHLPLYPRHALHLFLPAACRKIPAGMPDSTSMTMCSAIRVISLSSGLLLNVFDPQLLQHRPKRIVSMGSCKALADLHNRQLGVQGGGAAGARAAVRTGAGEVQRRAAEPGLHRALAARQSEHSKAADTGSSCAVHLPPHQDRAALTSWMTALQLLWKSKHRFLIVVDKVVGR